MTDTTAQQNSFHKIDMPADAPIVRGEMKIEFFNLRKPKAGELRGLSLQEVIGLDISALLKLVPRISDPVLTQPEVDALPSEVLHDVGNAIRDFFMTKAEKAVLEAFMAEHRPSS